MRTSYNPDLSPKESTLSSALGEVSALDSDMKSNETQKACIQESPYYELRLIQKYMGNIHLFGVLHREESGFLTLAHMALSALCALEKVLEEERAKR
jgi:hypothetical protein